MKKAKGGQGYLAFDEGDDRRERTCLVSGGLYKSAQAHGDAHGRR